MSQEYEGQDPLAIAQQAERDLNSNQAKLGSSKSDSTNDSGIDTSATDKFPGSTVKVGSSATGREIPVEEGGDISAQGRTTKDKDFEGEGGPETKQQMYEEANPGNDDVRAT